MEKNILSLPKLSNISAILQALFFICLFFLLKQCAEYFDLSETWIYVKILEKVNLRQVLVMIARVIEKVIFWICVCNYDKGRVGGKENLMLTWLYFRYF